MKNARFCCICLCSLDENCYLLCKSTNEGLTAAGHALFLLTEIDSRNEVQEDVPTRPCKSCYDVVLRVKKNDDDVAAKKESLKERLAKSRSFFFGTKPQPEPSGPMLSTHPYQVTFLQTYSNGAKSENVRKKVDMARGLRSSSP